MQQSKDKMRDEHNVVREPWGVEWDSPAANKYILEGQTTKLTCEDCSHFPSEEWRKAFWVEGENSLDKGMKCHDVLRELLDVWRGWNTGGKWGDERLEMRRGGRLLCLAVWLHSTGCDTGSEWGELWFHFASTRLWLCPPRGGSIYNTQRLAWASGVSVVGLADLSESAFLCRAEVLRPGASESPRELVKTQIAGSSLRISAFVGLG